MRDVLDQLGRWWEAGDRVGLATVVDTDGSAPRTVGACLLVGPDGSVVGSVSGGCVEGAVYQVATAVRDGAAPGLRRYGISDEDAFSVGLTCGGLVDIFTEQLSRDTFPEFADLAGAVGAGTPVALATIVDGRADQLGRHLLIWPDRVEGDLGTARIDAAVADDGRGLLAAGRTATLTYGPAGERLGAGLRVLITSFAPAARMLIFGAVDFAAALARMGRFLGYRVTVCDARPVFATPERFPDADEVVVDWPHRYLRAQAAALDSRTVVCVLTHDPKFDVPVLETALSLPVAYIGAMGSRRTHRERLAALAAAGVPADQLARLSSPIGLDLGARTPEETAVSIAAEIVAARWHGAGRPLRELDGPVHRREPQDSRPGARGGHPVS